MGTDRSRDHGRASPGMIIVQRGMKWYMCVVMLKKLHSCMLCHPTMKEATELSSLKSQLQDLEVPLFAVVKENLGKELDCFKKFFPGKVYVDQKV